MHDCSSENPPQTSSRVVDVTQLLSALRSAASASELAARFFVGESTMRKVLRELEHGGHVRAVPAAPGSRTRQYARSVPPLRREAVLKTLQQDQLTRAELCSLLCVNKVVMARQLRVLEVEGAIEWTLVRPPSGHGPRPRRYRIAGTDPIEPEAATRYVPRRSDTRRLAVLELLEKEPLTLKQIAARLECSSHTAYAHIAALRDECLVAGVPVRQRHGRGRPAFLWALAPGAASAIVVDREARLLPIAEPIEELDRRRSSRKTRKPTHREAQIRAILASGPHTIRDVAAAINLSYTRTSIVLAGLYFSGKVQRSYRDRTIVYSIAAKQPCTWSRESANAA